MLRKISRAILALTCIAAGANHFLRPRLYQSIMPDYLPWHAELVAISGYAEMALGGLVLAPGKRQLARWSLTALLLAIFPANIHMALHSERYPSIPAWLLWLRLPFQGVLIAWVWWSTGE